MTIRDIAVLAGVSPATVSLVLNNKKGVGEATRAHVQAILAQHNYTKSRKSGRPSPFRILFLKYRTHGMAVEENQGFIASIIDHIESECRRFSYNFLLQNCNASTIEETFRQVSISRPNGIILLGTELEPENFHYLSHVEVPLVVLDNSMAFQNIDSVVMNNRSIACAAIDYLVSLGHTRIGYLKSSITVSNLMERYEGYLCKLSHLGMQVPSPIYLRPTLNGAYEDMKHLLEKGNFQPQSAFFAENDSVAIGCSRALQEAGYRVPEEISIIGVDDIPYSSVTMPALTTMRISRSALGVLVLDLVRKRIKYPHWPTMNIQVDGVLIPRDSTAAYLSSQTFTR